MEYTRPIKLAVRHGFLSLLASERLPNSKDSVLDLLTARGQVQYVDSMPSGAWHGEVCGERAVSQPFIMIGEPSVAIIETRHLEQALRDVLQNAPNVHFLNGYSVELMARPALGLDGAPAFGVSLHRMLKDDQGKWTASSAGVDIGTPDMILAADGAQSHTVRDAGIGLKVGQSMGRFVVGTVRVPEGRNTMKKVSINDEVSGELHVYANVTGHLQEAWVIVEVPPAWGEAELKDRGKVEEHFRKVSAKVLDLDPSTQEVLWGGSAAFTLRPSITTELGRGNVWPIGDASGNNSFVVGGGTVGGLHEGKIAAETIVGMPAGDDASKVLEHGRKASYLASMAWHLHGSPDVQEELGVRALMNTNLRQRV